MYFMKCRHTQMVNPVFLKLYAVTCSEGLEQLVEQSIFRVSLSKPHHMLLVVAGFEICLLAL